MLPGSNSSKDTMSLDMLHLIEAGVAKGEGKEEREKLFREGGSGSAGAKWCES